VLTPKKFAQNAGKTLSPTLHIILVHFLFAIAKKWCSPTLSVCWLARSYAEKLKPAYFEATMRF